MKGDCEENKPMGFTGVTTISLENEDEAEAVNTFCTDDGWTVIQSRGQFNFPKDFFSEKLWNDYKRGFGVPGQMEFLFITRCPHELTPFLNVKNSSF